LEQLKLLWELQELEHHISRREKELHDIKSMITYQEKKKVLNTFEKKINEKEEHLGRESKIIRRKEMELYKIMGSLNELQEKLYGGKMHNIKELENMEKKARSLEEEKAGLEDEILHLMEKIEGDEEEIVLEKKQFAKEQKKLQQLKQVAQGDWQQAKDEFTDLNRTREDLLEKIDNSLLKKYRDLSQRFQGRAVSLVKKGFCGVCHVSLPSSFRALLLTPGELVFCENCGCLLVLGD
jgi:predicted  nucleic acid-binding Zn-ribbon protein